MENTDFKLSRTYQNLVSAYGDSLIANAKYGLFMKKANQDILIEIGLTFETIARNKQYIAERLRFLIFGSTPESLQNLEEASAEELNASNLYREYSRTATEEGYSDIASLFNGIANINLNHNNTFQTVIDEIYDNELFCKPQQRLWLCLGCGNILAGECAPELCPICGYPQSYYQMLR
ncbi:MAG: hypothetical protein K0R34_212 [Herbinix sp.]|jgi:rubrerythrin|nr:hypothetical protein [Herbinix sp.]